MLGKHARWIDGRTSNHGLLTMRYILGTMIEYGWLVLGLPQIKKGAFNSRINWTVSCLRKDIGFSHVIFRFAANWGQA